MAGYKYESLFSNVLASSVMPVLKNESLLLAEKMKKEVIRRIRSQVGLRPALNRRYLNRKIRYGYSSDTLIMTEQYVNSITVIPTVYGAMVGVKNINHWTPVLTGKARNRRGSPYAKVRERGYRSVPMIKIAEWMEYGTTMTKKGKGGPAAGQPWHIPPRPHWRPAQQKFIRDLAQLKGRLTKAMSDAMNRALEVELANNPDLLQTPEHPRFANEPQTRDRYDIRPNRASRLLNKYKLNEYQKIGVPPPEG